MSTRQPSPPSAGLGCLFALANLATMTESQRADVFTRNSPQGSGSGSNPTSLRTNSRTNSPAPSNRPPFDPTAGSENAMCQQHQPDVIRQDQCREKQKQPKRRPAKKRPVPSDDIEIAPKKEFNNQGPQFAHPNIAAAAASSGVAESSSSPCSKSVQKRAKFFPSRNSSNKKIKTTNQSSKNKNRSTRSKGGSSTKEEKPTFPVILLGILSSPQNEEIISFLSDDQSFIVANPSAFEQEVLPVHFSKEVLGRNTHFSDVDIVKTVDDFTNLLTRWGFELESDPTKLPNGNDAVWRHDFFRKGDWEGCLKMSRVSPADKTTSSVSETGNSEHAGSCDGINYSSVKSEEEHFARGNVSDSPGRNNRSQYQKHNHQESLPKGEIMFGPARPVTPPADRSVDNNKQGNHRGITTSASHLGQASQLELSRSAILNPTIHSTQEGISFDAQHLNTLDSSQLELAKNADLKRIGLETSLLQQQSEMDYSLTNQSGMFRFNDLQSSSYSRRHSDLMMMLAMRDNRGGLMNDHNPPTIFASSADRSLGPATIGSRYSPLARGRAGAAGSVLGLCTNTGHLGLSSAMMPTSMNSMPTSYFRRHFLQQQLSRLKVQQLQSKVPTDEEVKLATQDVVSAAIVALHRCEEAHSPASEVPRASLFDKPIQEISSRRTAMELSATISTLRRGEEAHSQASQVPRAPSIDKHTQRTDMEYIQRNSALSTAPSSSISLLNDNTTKNNVAPCCASASSRLDAMAELFLERSRARLSSRPAGITGPSYPKSNIDQSSYFGIHCSTHSPKKICDL